MKLNVKYSKLGNDKYTGITVEELELTGDEQLLKRIQTLDWPAVYNSTKKVLKVKAASSTSGVVEGLMSVVCYVKENQRRLQVEDLELEIELRVDETKELLSKYFKKEKEDVQIQRAQELVWQLGNILETNCGQQVKNKLKTNHTNPEYIVVSKAGIHIKRAKKVYDAYIRVEGSKKRELVLPYPMTEHTYCNPLVVSVLEDEGDSDSNTRYLGQVLEHKLPYNLKGLDTITVQESVRLLDKLTRIQNKEIKENLRALQEAWGIHKVEGLLNLLDSADYGMLYYGTKEEYARRMRVDVSTLSEVLKEKRVHETKEGKVFILD